MLDDIDYDTCELIFQSSIEVGGEYNIFVPGFCKLINDFIQYSVLQGDIGDKTEQFVYHFIPSVCSSFLRLGEAPRSEVQIICDALKSMVDIFIWSFGNDKNELYNSLLGILDRDSPFYENNYMMDMNPSSMIASYFIDNGGFKYFKERCCSTEKQPSLNHFVTFFDVYQRIDLMVSFILDYACLNESLSVLSNILNNYIDTDFKDIEINKLSSACLKFLSVCNRVTSIPETFADTLIHLSEKCVLCDNLEKRICGASILKEISSFYGNPFKKTYQEWASTTQLADSLIGVDLHSQFLSLFESVFPLILRPHHFGRFWKFAIGSHSSQKNILLSIMAKSLKSLSSDEATEFINLASEEADASEMIRFIAQTISSCVSNDSDFASALLHRLFQLSKKECNITNAIESLIHYQLPNSFKKIIVMTSLQYLSDSDVHYSCIPILSKILKYSFITDSNFPNDFPSSFVKQYFVFNSPNNEFYSFLISLHETYKRILETNVLQTLFCHSKDDQIWLFLRKLLEKRGLSAYSEGVISIIHEKITNFCFAESSQAFCAFLFYFVLYINLSKGNIVHKTSTSQSSIISSSFIEFKNLPIFNQTYILQLLFSTRDDNVGLEAQHQIVQFFLRASNKNDSIDQIMSIFHEGEKLGSQPFRRAILLTYNYLHQAECLVPSTDFGIVHHKNKMANLMTIHVEYNDERKSFTVEPASKPESLRSRVSLVFNILEGNIKLVDSTSRTIMTYFTLYDAKVKNNDVLFVKPLYNAISTSNRIPFLPIRQFSEAKYQQILLNHLAQLPNCNDKLSYVSSLQRAIVKLLNFLPSISLLNGSTDNNFSKILHQLDNCDQFQAFIYQIECLINELDQLHLQEFCILGGTRIIVDHLQQLTFDNTHSHRLFFVLEFLFSPPFHEFANICIPILLNFFTQPKCSKSVSNIICSYFINVPDIANEIITNNIEILSTIIDNLSEVSWPCFQRVLFLLTDKIHLFDLCLQHLDNINNVSKYYVHIFAYLVPSISHIDVTVILNKSILLLQTSSDLSFSGLCTVITSILNANPSLSNLCVGLSEYLLPLAFRFDNEDKHRSIFMLLKAINYINTNQLLSLIPIKIDRWNYQPSDNRRSLLGFSGLRNLGATCYMNSILQQLFFTLPFRSLFLSEVFNDESHQLLQLIFTKLLLSKRRFCDTQPFVDIWKGWGKRIVNPREQQDAFEFLQIILDQLPQSLNSIFKGTIKNTIEGTSHAYESSNMENFYTIPLDVKGQKTVQDSFNVFLQSETFNGDCQYMADGIGKIDAKKYSRIFNCPPILVLQLKRFEYDLTTFNRIKVNDRYEIPETFDVRCLMSEEGESIMYHLSGVVLHSGNAAGGHYTSLIRMNNKWICFNDAEVTEISNEKFINDSFGGIPCYDEYDSASSAYLLFYRRSDALFNGLQYQDYVDSQISINPEYLSLIEKDNLSFFTTQTLFSEPFLDFVLECSDDIVLSYIIYIYSHSSFASQASRVINRIDIIFASQKEQHVCDFLLQHFDSLFEVFISCGDEAILNVIVYLATESIKFPHQGSVDLGEKLLTVLPQVLTVWRQVPYINRIIHQYIVSHTQQAYHNKCIEHLNSFISTIYNGSRSSIVLQNIDISDIFSSLCHIINNCVEFSISQYDFSELILYTPMITQSQHNVQSLFRFFLNLKSKEVISNQDLIHMINQTKKDIDRDILSSICYTILIGDQSISSDILRIAQSKKILDLILKNILFDIRNNKEEARAIFILNPHNLIDFLTDRDNEIARISEFILISLFPQIKKLKDMPKLSTIRIESHRQNRHLTKISHQIPTDLLDLMQRYYLVGIKKIGQIMSNIDIIYTESSYADLKSFIRVMYWIMKRAKLHNSFDFQTFFGLFSSIVSVKRHYDPNHNTLLSFLLKYPNNVLTSDNIIRVLELSIDLPHKTPSYYYLNVFGYILPHLPKLSDESLSYFLKLPSIHTLIKNMAQSYQEKDINNVIVFIKFLHSKISVISHIKFIFVSFFTTKSFNSFRYNSLVLTNVYDYCFYYLPDNLVTEYAMSFFKLLNERMSSQYISDMTFIEYCTKALLKNLAWIGYIDNKSFDLYKMIEHLVDPKFEQYIDFLCPVFHHLFALESIQSSKKIVNRIIGIIQESKFHISKSKLVLFVIDGINLFGEDITSHECLVNCFLSYYNFTEFSSTLQYLIDHTNPHHQWIISLLHHHLQTIPSCSSLIITFVRKSLRLLSDEQLIDVFNNIMIQFQNHPQSHNPLIWACYLITLDPPNLSFRSLIPFKNGDYELPESIQNQLFPSNYYIQHVDEEDTMEPDTSFDNDNENYLPNIY